jgi:hypothetical protein
MLCICRPGTMPCISLLVALLASAALADGLSGSSQQLDQLEPLPRDIDLAIARRRREYQLQQSMQMESIKAQLISAEARLERAEKELRRAAAETKRVSTMLDDFQSQDMPSPATRRLESVAGLQPKIRFGGTATVNSDGTDLEVSAGTTTIIGALNLDASSGFVNTAEFTALDGVTSSIQSQLDGKQDEITSATRIDATLIAGGVVTNTEFNKLNGMSSTKIQVQLDGKQALITSAARLDASLVGTGSVTTAEFNSLDGVTSGIQTQLNGKASIASVNLKQDEITSAARLDASLVGTGSVTTAEFNSLDGVTSGIQTQLNGKASTADLTALNDQVANLQNTVASLQANLATKDYVENITFGFNQTWTDVTAYRQKNVWYQNDTPKPIMVSFQSSDTFPSPGIRVGPGTAAGEYTQVIQDIGSSGNWKIYIAVIPANHYYLIQNNMRYWFELR